MSVSPGEASVTESQGSLEVCLEADGELETGTEIVIMLSTSNITASGTYTNSFTLLCDNHHCPSLQLVWIIFQQWQE